MPLRPLTPCIRHRRRHQPQAVVAPSNVRINISAELLDAQEKVNSLSHIMSNTKAPCIPEDTGTSVLHNISI